MEDQIVDHFSHYEPLKLFEVRDDGIIDGKRYSRDIKCKLCKEPISLSTGSSFYACISHYIFVHKTCAQLKQSFDHPLHPIHPLSRISSGEYSALSCDLCDRRLIYDYCYRCKPCKFIVCIKCASAEIAQNEVAIALKQESVSKFIHEGHHPRHTLIFHSKSAAFLCNACQTEKKDLFYHCDHCDDFLIHKTCAMLTPAIDRPHYHRHPLSLAFSLPEKFYNYKYKCDVCNKRVMQPEWTYHCSNCRYFIHIKCLPSPDQLPATTQRVEELKGSDGDILHHFPMSHAFTDPLRFHSERSSADHTTTIAAAAGGDDKRAKIDHWSHDHPLFLTAAAGGKNNMPPAASDDDLITVCHCCVRPLSLSDPYYYSCKHDGCSFTLHEYCVELPRTLQQHPLHPNHPSLRLRRWDDDWLCKACDKRCNAFMYQCETRNCYFRLDVNCAFLPEIIKHEFHKQHQHRLVQHIGPGYISQCTICERRFDGRAGYKCDDDYCDFRVDMHCALRSPCSLPHRYCKGGHEVPLMFPPIEDHPDDFYCDICEEEMSPLIPLYYCAKCKNSFHVRCLSRYYRWENWLEEGTDVSVPIHHNHPLTYVRRKKPPKEVCFGCNGDINGLLFLECRTGNCPYSLCLECSKW